MAKRKRRKSPWKWLRYRRGDVAHNLLVAAQRYIHANGGTAVVLGGIKIIKMPDANEHVYEIAVGFMGLKPRPMSEPAKQHSDAQIAAA